MISELEDLLYTFASKVIALGAVERTLVWDTAYDLKDQMWQYFLEWREVEVPCEGCGGTGKRQYGSTSTWRGGFGGQAMAVDICDRCWGSGDKTRPFRNLRNL